MLEAQAPKMKPYNANRLPIGAPLTRLSFLAMLAAARTGDKIIYHVGSLMFDRQIGASFQAIHGLAYAVMEACEQGRVLLVQHKICDNRFEYIAVKT